MLTVIGGGIIGLFTAWRIVRKRQCEVVIVDAPSDLPPATLASAAMLAPGAEGHLCAEALYRLGKESLLLYPYMLQELEQETGERVELTSAGTLLVAEGRGEVEWLRSRRDELSQLGEPYERLSGGEAREREPALASTIVEALHIPGDRTLSLPTLLQALRLALSKYQVKFLQERVTGLVEEAQVVIATGAWSAPLQGPQLFPNQGVVVELSHQRAVRHMIRSRHVYICPKGDGTMRIGASADYLGCDLRPRLGSAREIVNRAWEILPGIDQETFLALHVGLRAEGESCLPIVRRAKRVYWAVGFGRSGVLLAPWCGERIANDRDFI
jgi:glycine oxidase